jgi:hypothetical protein
MCTAVVQQQGIVLRSTAQQSKELKLLLRWEKDSGVVIAYKKHMQGVVIAY